jgi:crotonobetainyl-CoA:carnitine CoA-transferase CaiB-like acyl-CoA transferase
VAQAEVMLAQFAPEYLRESLDPGSLTAQGNAAEFHAPSGVYPCAGEDQWCVVTVHGPKQWDALCRVLGAADLAHDPALQSPQARVRARARLDARLGEWTAQRSPHEAMSLLQAEGVPAAAMLRAGELLADPHLAARGVFTTMHQPDLGELPAETGPARFARIGIDPSRPAPQHGEHSREIVAEVLGRTDEQIVGLLDAGVLEEWTPPVVHATGGRA